MAIYREKCKELALTFLKLSSSHNHCKIYNIHLFLFLFCLFYPPFWTRLNEWIRCHLHIMSTSILYSILFSSLWRELKRCARMMQNDLGALCLWCGMHQEYVETRWLRIPPWQIPWYSIIRREKKHTIRQIWGSDGAESKHSKRAILYNMTTWKSRIVKYHNPLEQISTSKKTIRLVYPPVVQMMEVPPPG